jgi:hypothetical protein
MRPTKYNHDVLAQTKDYLNNYEKYDHLFPSVIGLAAVLGIAKSTLSAWKKHDDKEEFSYTLQLIKDRQHLTLLNKGLTGEYNAAITKLMLYNFGYSDKRHIEKSNNVQVVKLRTNFDNNYDDYTDEELRSMIGRK